MHGEGLLIAWSLVVLALVLGSATKREDDDLTFWHYTDLPPSLQSCRKPNGRKGFCPEERWKIRKAAVDRMFNDEPNPNFIMLHLQDPSPDYPAKAVEHDQLFSLYLKKKFPETVILPILGTEGFSGEKNKDRYKLWSEYLPPGEERDTFEKCGYYSIRLDPSASSTPFQRWSGVEAGTAKFLALNMDPEAKDGEECDRGSWVRSQLNNIEKEGPTLISSYLYPSAEVDASPLSIIVPNPLNKGAGENWKNFEPVLTAPEWATKFGEIFGNKNELNASDILSTLVHEMTPKFFRRESEKNDSQKVEDTLVQVMHIGDQNDVVNFNITIVLVPVGIPPVELWLKQEQDPFDPAALESAAEMVKDILNKLVPDLQAKGSNAEQTLDPILIAQVIDYETIREMMEKKLGNISHLIGPNHRLKDVEEQLKAGSNLVLAFKSSMDPKATIGKYKEKMRRLMGTEKSPLHILEYANGWASTLGNHGDEEVLLKNSIDSNSGNPNNLRLCKSEIADPRSTQFLQYWLVSDSFIPMYWSKDGQIYGPSKNIRKGVLAAPSIQNLFNLQQDPSRDDDMALDPNVGGTGSWEQLQPWYGKGILSDNIKGQLKQYLNYGDKMVPRNGPSLWKNPFLGYPVPDNPFWNPEGANAFVNFKKTESNDEEDYEAGNIERADFWNPGNYYDESIFGLEGVGGDPENKNEPFWQKYNPGNKFWKNGLQIQNQASHYFGQNVPFIGMVQQEEDDAQGHPQGEEEGVARNAFRPKNYLGYGKKFREEFNNLVRPYFDVEKPFFGPYSDIMGRSGQNDLGASSGGKPFTPSKTSEDKKTVGEGRAFWNKYVPELKGKYPFNSLNPYYQGGQSGEDETHTLGGNFRQGVKSVQRKNEKPWAKKSGFDDNENLERKSRGIYADDIKRRESFESFSPWKAEENNSGRKANSFASGSSRSE